MCPYEDYSDEEPDSFPDGDTNEADADWLPPNAEDSDVEDLAEIDRMADAIEVESECDDERSEDEDDSHTSLECETSGKFTSRDQTIWNKSSLPTSQTRSYNILRESGKNNIDFISSYKRLSYT